MIKKKFLIDIITNLKTRKRQIFKPMLYSNSAAIKEYNNFPNKIKLVKMVLVIFLFSFAIEYEMCYTTLHLAKDV